MTIDPKNITVTDLQGYLQHAIAPRPVCLASTIDSDGNVNLSPFSFFNMFSSNPPILIFSPALRVRDGSTKHTLENVKEVPEVVVHICDYDMVYQVNLSSHEYDKNTDEFIKAGFTKERARSVTPPMVKEAKIKMECRVNEIKALGEDGGAGNLVICEVLQLHIDDSVLTENKIDQKKIQHIARLGGDWYCRVNFTNLFSVTKPGMNPGLGFDRLPADLIESTVLTNNDLAQLASIEIRPEIPSDTDGSRHEHAKSLLEKGLIKDAWQILLNDKINNDK